MLLVPFLVLSIGSFCGAEATTIEAGHATPSWMGQGVIDDLGEGERLFRGPITGTILLMIQGKSFCLTKVRFRSPCN
jgi:hypothetical protein